MEQLLQITFIRLALLVALAAISNAQTRCPLSVEVFGWSASSSRPPRVRVADQAGRDYAGAIGIPVVEGKTARYQVDFCGVGLLPVTVDVQAGNACTSVRIANVVP